LPYLFFRRRKENLFTSSLAIVQTITQLQSSSKDRKRKPYSREKTIEKLNAILPKMTVLDVTYNDVKTGCFYANSDIEDSVHYAISQKMNCNAILTCNESDFLFFKNILTIGPDLGILKSVLNK
jgi:predicted nucleic acid-binding protein